MANDKIVSSNKFYTGISSFPATSVGSRPLGYSPYLHHNKANNGISGFPCDTFLDTGTPPVAQGEWTLEQAYFNATATDDNILDYTSDVNNYFLSTYMSPDGVYFFGETGNVIYRFTLSTPFKISTATLDVGQTFSTGNSINGVCFNPTGTDMYFTDGTNDTIEQYTLSTAYDLTSASSTGSSGPIPDQAFISIKISGDGVYFLLFSYISPYPVLRYILSTPFDITTAGNSVNQNFGALSTNISRNGIISSDGTSIIIIVSAGLAGIILKQFFLSTPYDPTSATSDHIAFPVQFLNREYEPLQVFGAYFCIEPNGKYAYIYGDYPGALGTEHLILQLQLFSECANCWDIANLTYNTVLKNVSTEETTPKSISYSQEGLHAYVIGTQVGKIHHYTVSTPYVVNTLSYDVSQDISTDDPTPVDIFVCYITNTNYVRRIFVLGATNNTIYSYEARPDDFSAVFSLAQSFSVASETTSPTALFFSSDGTKLFVLDSSGVIYQYSITATNPFSLSHTSYDSVSYSVTQDNDCRGLAFSRSGLIMWVTGNQNKKINQFNLTNRWDISSGVTFDTDYSVSGQVDQLNGLFVAPKGDNFQVVSSGTADAVIQLDIS